MFVLLLCDSHYVQRFTAIIKKYDIFVVYDSSCCKALSVERWIRYSGRQITYLQHTMISIRDLAKYKPKEVIY